MKYILFYCLLVTAISSTADTALVKAAKSRLNAFVVYDRSYQKIAYPNGDVDTLGSFKSKTSKISCCALFS